MQTPGSVRSTPRPNAVAPSATSRVTALSPTSMNPVTAIERKEAPGDIAQVVRPSHDEIAKAAYLRWLKTGGEAETNWIEAERELMRSSKSDQVVTRR